VSTGGAAAALDAQPQPASFEAPPVFVFSASVIEFSGRLATYTLRGYIGRMRKDIKTSCQKRLSRIEGQVRGLSKMVEEDRYCIDIVTQISAVRAALRRVEEEVLRDHVSHCVEHAITSGNKADQREKISELMAVIGRADR
jgi:DNA-binding FrmR family transcriptional regulator